MTRNLRLGALAASATTALNRRLRRRRCAALMLAALGVAGCGGSGDRDGEKPQGGLCQVCRTTAPRCDAQLFCNHFTFGAAGWDLCATPSTTSCPQP